MIAHWQFMLIFTSLWHIFWLAFSNLCMWGIYHLEHPFFERYKINTMPWPWNENRQDWNILLKKSLKTCFFNSFVCVPLTLIGTLYSDNFVVAYDFSVENLPDWKTFAANITFCMLCEDVAFHFMHRFLHWKVIYPYIHKQHHQYITTISIAAEYSHPIDYVFGALIPGSLGGIILGRRMHFVTFLLWSLMRTSETLDGHCGYEFSWSPYRLIPFSTSAAYHDFHHSHNVGNYSSFFSFWDTLFAQNKDYYQFQEKTKELIEKLEKENETFNEQVNKKLQDDAPSKRATEELEETLKED